jgi:soluble lytic murein transglycosylase
MACALAGLMAGACNAPGPTASPAPPTVTVTATLTGTPTATPTPTPPPESLLEEAARALSYGDWDLAFSTYEAVRAAPADDAAAAEALLGYATTLQRSGRVWEAIDAFTQFISAHPQDPQFSTAVFRRAQARQEAALYDLAAEDYRQFLTLEPGVLDSYVHEQLGDLQRAAGRPLDSIAEYQAAAAAPRLGGTRSLEIDIGLAYLEGARFAEALAQFDAIQAQATDGASIATLNLLAGRALEGMGDSAGAYARYLDSVERFPAAYDSYTGLITLVDAGVDVDDFQRGLVDYYAEAYDPALQALDRAVASRPDAAAYYYRGLTRRALGDANGALTDLAYVVEAFPQDALWKDALWQKALTEWGYLDMYSVAVQTYLQYAASLPQDERAPEALFRAGRTAERVNDLALAADLWLRLPAEAPASPYAYRGAFQAAIARYRLGDFAAARKALSLAESIAADTGGKAAAQMWIGKAFAAQGDAESARQAWETARALDPTGYYSVRAAQLLDGRSLFQARGIPDFAVDSPAEQQAAEDWLRATFPVAGTEPLSDLDPALASDPRMVRGKAFARLGLLSEARDEFDSLRQDLNEDPVALYRLMHTLLDLHMYPGAIFSARQILRLAGMDDAATMNAPVYFNRIRFGPYFGDLILPRAAADGFDGLFLLSVVRQESLFEGGATSSAAARGLMQVIPGTGQGIAERLGWPPDYTTRDLYRPSVSVRFGANYLTSQRERYDGDLVAALAAYNAGPGNADAWKELAPDDPDLFIEVIRLDEPQRYIRTIAEILDIYERLYLTN